MDRKEFENLNESLEGLKDKRFESIIRSIEPIALCAEYKDTNEKIIIELEKAIAKTEKAIAEYNYTVELKGKLAKDWREDSNNPYNADMPEAPNGR